MKRIFGSRLVLATFLTIASSAPSGLSGAELGEPAPPVVVAEWIQGGAPQLGADQIRLVFFWSTTNRPSRDALVPLAALEKEMRPKVQVVAISDQEPETVRGYLERFTKGIELAVGIDQEKQTFAAYVEAFGVTLEAPVFVVDKLGRVVWFGETAGVRKVVDQVLAGTFEVADVQRRAEYQKQSQALLSEYFGAIMSGAPVEETQETVEKLFAIGKQFPEALTALARGILIVPGLKSRDFDTGLRATTLARSLGAKDFDASLYHAKILIELGRTSEAVQVLEALRAGDLTNDQRRTVAADLSRCRDSEKGAGAAPTGKDAKPPETGATTRGGAGVTSKPKGR